MTFRVLFAGGTGFIGKTFLEHHALWSAIPGFDLTIFSRDPAAFVAANPALMKRIGGDVRLVRQRLPHIDHEGAYDVIVHGLEVPSLDLSHDHVEQSLRNMESLQLFARKAGARRFVYLSSGAIYTLNGQLRPPFAVDADLGKPDPDGDIYALSKYRNEQSLRAFSQSSGISHSIIRIFNVASAHVPLNGRYALGNFVRDAMSPDIAAIEINGSGRDLRSFIDGRALSALMLHCMTGAKDDAIFNGCSDEAISIRELATIVRDIANVEKPLVVLNEDMVARHYTGIPNLPPHCVSNAEGLRAAIGSLIDNVRTQSMSDACAARRS